MIFILTLAGVEIKFFMAPGVDSNNWIYRIRIDENDQNFSKKCEILIDC